MYLGRKSSLGAAALGALLLSTHITPAAASEDCTNHGGLGTGQQIVGTLIGAAVGGLLGSQIGGGTGNKIAIGAGVLAGGLLGNRLGHSLDCNEQQKHQATAQDALEYQRTGTTASWENPDSGHAGTVTPTRTYQRTDGRYCREFTQTITVNGEIEEAAGTACRQPDGTWQIVS